MTESPWKYARGTPKWNAVAAQYGEAAADAQWQAAIDAERNQTPLDTSTWRIFAGQIYNDPLAAPIEQANTIFSNGFAAAFKNPAFLVVAVVVGVAAFFLLGGANLLRKLK